MSEIEANVEREVRLTLKMDADTAARLTAVLYASVNFARHPWAQKIAAAVEASVLIEDEQYDAMRREVQYHVEATEDDTSEDEQLWDHDPDPDY